MKRITRITVLVLFVAFAMSSLSAQYRRCGRQGEYVIPVRVSCEEAGYLPRESEVAAKATLLSMKNDPRFISVDGRPIFVRGKAEYDQLDWSPEYYYGFESLWARFLNMLARLIPRGIVNAFDKVFQKGGKIVWTPEVARSMETERGYQYAGTYTPASASVQHAIPATISRHVWVAENLYVVPENQKQKSRFGPTKKSILFTAVLVGGGLAVCLPDENSRGCEIGGEALFGGAQVAASYRRFEQTGDIRFRIHGTFRNAATDELVSDSALSGDWSQAFSQKGWVLLDSAAFETNWNNVAGAPLEMAMLDLQRKILAQIEERKPDVRLVEIMAKRERGEPLTDRELSILASADKNVEDEAELMQLDVRETERALQKQRALKALK